MRDLPYSNRQKESLKKYNIETFFVAIIALQTKHLFFVFHRVVVKWQKTVLVCYRKSALKSHEISIVCTLCFKGRQSLGTLSRRKLSVDRTSARMQNMSNLHQMQQISKIQSLGASDAAVLICLEESLGSSIITASKRPPLLIIFFQYFLQPCKAKVKANYSFGLFTGLLLEVCWCQKVCLTQPVVNYFFGQVFAVQY